MPILMAASGSYGDVLPFVGLGRELTVRGEDVILFSNGQFAEEAEKAGLAFEAVGTAEEYEQLVERDDLFDPREGFKVIAETIHEYTPDLYERMRDAVRPGETVLVASTLAFGARLLWETTDAPLATVHLAPSMFRSVRRPPRMNPGVPRWWPGILQRAAHWALDRFLIDPIFTEPLNRYRAELGLSPVRRLFQTWIHEGDILLGLFPDWFGLPQPDWPKNPILTGFPLEDGAGEGEKLPDEVSVFLEAGSAPIVFAAGSAAAEEGEFFAAAVEACRASGSRGLLLTRYPDQLPDPLPEGLRHVRWAPFSLLFPRAAAVVHHGGIGTTSQAFQAGVPQVIRPMAYDQYDNADRVVTLGAGRELPKDRFDPVELARLFDEVTASKEMTDTCNEIAARIAERDGIGRACDLIQSIHPQNG